MRHPHDPLKASTLAMVLAADAPIRHTRAAHYAFIDSSAIDAPQRQRAGRSCNTQEQTQLLRLAKCVLPRLYLRAVP